MACRLPTAAKGGTFEFPPLASRRPLVVNSPAPILVGHWPNKVVWIRVQGKGSFQNSPQLRECVDRMLVEGERRFVVDLADCPVMDSTFMGTLTGIARALRAYEGGKLEVLNANTRNVQLIRSLGLDHVFDLDADGGTWTEERRAVAARFKQAETLVPVQLNKREQTEFILRAHEELTEADTANAPRFEDVIKYLKKELDESRA